MTPAKSIRKTLIPAESRDDFFRDAYNRALPAEESSAP